MTSLLPTKDWHTRAFLASPPSTQNRALWDFISTLSLTAAKYICLSKGIV